MESSNEGVQQSPVVPVTPAKTATNFKRKQVDIASTSVASESNSPVTGRGTERTIEGPVGTASGVDSDHVVVSKRGLYKLLFTLLTGNPESIARGNVPRVICEVFELSQADMRPKLEDIKQVMIYGGK